MKSKPGALKRKQKLDNEERARFARNLAQLSGGADAGSSRAEQGAIQSNRWAALRGFIGQTLERRADVSINGGVAGTA
jgi:hypothetical protein